MFVSTFNRRAVLHAELDTAALGTVHVFCTHLTAIFSSIPWPKPEGSWQEEQLAQINGAEASIAIAQQDCRRHRGKHALAGLDCIGLGTNQAVDVRHARFRRKIVHLVVQQYARVFRHETRSKGIIDTECCRNAISGTINN